MCTRISSYECRSRKASLEQAGCLCHNNIIFGEVYSETLVDRPTSARICFVRSFGRSNTRQFIKLALLMRGLMTINRVSVDSAGDQAIRLSVGSSISADGRLVAFAYGTSLVPADASGSGDIFVRDLSTNTTTPVSVDSAGNRAIGVGFFPSSLSPSISADGRFVAFESNATNLVPGDTNSYRAIFARDLSTNTTTLVSVDSAGNRGNNYSLSPSISADGRFVAFYSNASNLVPGDNYNFDIFVRDTLANTTTGVSVDSAGDRGNRDSYSPSISADGRFVAFESDATNLVPGDTNNGRDIFVRDTLANTTTGVSVDSAGDRGNR
ncbi:TolB family protein, partial [Microcoleus sp. Pol17C2]|uniref:TolB family protein n=1 Tax=Microcoleus sp. Pol17C2 TaxID=3055403 RepID=UPI0040407343